MDTLLFECIGMKNGTAFPITNTGRGQDISPAFWIKNLSSDAKTLAVTLEDINHPLFKNFTHWLIWNIPASQSIAEAIPGGRIVESLGKARQGLGYGWYRYAGPKPPKGRRHLYRFTVYALDSAVDLKFPPTKNRFLRKAKGRIIQCGSMICAFE
ncbi:MAG: YbhB/YbcL family Raf kinase inhibitor-like protein [Clostridiales bacterium]|nr:YbhB/YbcL family Raf kinase inhibitor-like protein [Clostridiales bacterium]